MTEEQHNGSNAEGQESKEPKRVSLAEAVKAKLEQKKQAQANAVGRQKQSHQGGGGLKMKSQNTKKINNQRKRMGV
ncbi:hypothetical protein [Paenibacillus tarimensis]|uniref:hypothetical protein n=1 Tax=Paenibacillus tarimensis TaxID=416012 RepID=UPI001F31CABA|nr:hypothetical protein [Paenibacillus tarimensis]MCF2943622.1 hypothetical protein [Paenibacillus tarimensis]